MNSQKTYWSLLPVILLFFLTACEMDSTPTPTPVFVGCSESDLIQAIKDANANVDPTIINLDGSCEYTFNVVEDSSNLDFMTHHSGLPAITTEITIQGNGAVLDIQKNPGEPFFGHFFVNGTSGGDLALYQLTLSGGNRQLGGSVINASGDFFASGVRFVDNLAYSSNDSIAKGGAIFSSSGRVRVINGSEFQNNLAGETIANGVNKGGAIYSRNDNLLVSDSSFHANFAAGSGGAIFAEKIIAYEGGVAVQISDSEFQENSAETDGGALVVDNVAEGVFIATSLFSQNSAGNFGGAIYAEGTEVSVDHTTLDLNNADYGGAVYTKKTGEEMVSVFISDNSTFSNNTASEIGGAIFSENSDLILDDSLLLGNMASSCGAISTGGNPTIDIMAGDLETAPHFASTTQITDSNFGLNQALQTHGGALCHVMGDLTIQDTMFQENHAVSMGGGLLLLDKNQLSGLTVYSNTAERGGGIAIGYPYNYTPGRTIMGPIYLTVNSTISGSEFSWNEAIFRGGGLWADQVGWTNITKSTFSYNISDFTGGGIYQSHGDLSITNSNLAGNFALRGGGLYAEGTWTSDPILDIKHTTIAHNTAFETTPVISRWGGGGLNVGGDINIMNSLIALNSSIDCQIADSYTNWSESGTVDSDGECDAFLTEPNPALGPLSWDGGTPTYALLANSPLLDILSDCAGITDDQRGISRPQGSACDPGSYEFDPSDPPWQPPVPPSLPPDSTDCDPFSGVEYSLVMLNVAPGSTDLTLYLKVTGGVQVALPAIQAEDIKDLITAILGNTGANLCNMQGFDDRIYCMFTLPPSVLGTTQDLKFFKPGCEDPVLLLAGVSIPTPNLVCKESLGEEDCKAAGGKMSEGGRSTAPYCVCP